MKEIAAVLDSVSQPKAVRNAAKLSAKVFRYIDNAKWKAEIERA